MKRRRHIKYNIKYKKKNTNSYIYSYRWNSETCTYYIQYTCAVKYYQDMTHKAQRAQSVAASKPNIIMNNNYNIQLREWERLKPTQKQTQAQQTFGSTQTHPM